MPKVFPRRLLRDLEKIHRLIGDYRNRQAVLGPNEHIREAQRLAPQGKGILGAGGNEPPAKRRYYVVHLIGEAQNTARHRFRLRIAGEARTVMLVDSQRHCFFFSVQKGIGTPHDALQFGELRHHARDEIGLGEQGRPPGLRRFFGRCP